jgi:hypothetical protein
MEDIEFSMSYRIPKIEGLDQCLVLKVSQISNVNNNLKFRDWDYERI